MKKSKKRIVIILLIILFVIAFPTIYITFGGLPHYNYGHDIETIAKHFQNLEKEKVTNCEWHLQNAHGLVSVFYGYIVVDENYIEITSNEYSWVNSESYLEKYSLNFTKKRYRVNAEDVACSETFAKHLAVYTEDQSALFLLDEGDNKLYFELYY